jgi:hypothetical protein
MLPQFRQTLIVVCLSFQQTPTPTPITDIHYVTTSVNKCMRCPCSLCESLDNFTYQFPMIIEYMHCQLAPIHNHTPPIDPINTLTPSIDMVQIFPLEPEALPSPPWLLDDLYEELPLNPPNYPNHFPTNILRLTTIFNPQYLDIWFMSSEPSQSPYIFIRRRQCHSDSH